MNSFLTLVLPLLGGGALVHLVHVAKMRDLRHALSDAQKRLAAVEKKEGSSLAPSELAGQLSNALNLRSSEDQVLWSAFGTFWAANAILLVALFSTGKLPESPIVAPVVSIVGLAISLVWHGIQNRALGHVARYESLAADLEEQLNVPAALSVSARRDDAGYQRYLSGGPRARDLMKWCSRGAALLWAVALVVFVVLGGRGHAA